MATNRTRAARKVDAARKVTGDLRKNYAETHAVESVGEVKRQVKVAVFKVRKTKSGQMR